ncbi:MAG TPA: hypothetical protein VGK67_04275 [Myxococcales bacterium]
MKNLSLALATLLLAVPALAAESQAVPAPAVDPAKPALEAQQPTVPVAPPALDASADALKRPLPARDTADVGLKGEYSVGVFNPLKVALVDGVELQLQPLLFFVAPNVLFRVAHGEMGGFRWASEYGVYCPTPLMKLTQGYAIPTWSKGGGQVGWLLVPSVGIAGTYGKRTESTLTFAADLTVGIPLTHNDATGAGSIAPLDDLLSPVTTGLRLRVNATYDLSLLTWLRARAYLGLSLHGKNPSPITMTGGGSLDFAVGRYSRFTLGFMWWNSDSNAIDYATHQHVRSNDFFPTIDFIWAG